MADKPNAGGAPYDAKVVITAMRQAMQVLQAHDQHPATAMAVAGLIVWMETEVNGRTLDEAIAMLRVFVAELQASGLISRAT